MAATIDTYFITMIFCKRSTSICILHTLRQLSLLGSLASVYPAIANLQYCLQRAVC